MPLGHHTTGLPCRYLTPPSHADIDECENHLACPGQECVNTPGSFQCQPCREGFQLHRGRCAGTPYLSPHKGAPSNPTGDPHTHS